MNEDAIKDAYDLFVNTGYNKSYENFKTLIQSNPAARKDAYDLFVSTGYNKTQKDFDELMGIGAPAPVKKKEQVSPSQQKKQPTSSATGAMGQDGAPAPSASSSNKYSVPLWLQTQEPQKPQATEESLPFMAPKPQGINLGSERVPEKGPMFGVGKPEFKEPEKIDKNLARLETSLVDMDEEQATEKLKYLFGDLGFTFDQAGYGYDAITVTSPSGKKLDLSWDNFSSKQDEYVLGQLTDFISKESKAPSNAAKLEKYYEESNKKFVDQREINETIATLSKKSDDVNKLIKGYVVKRDALENEGKVLEETPENLRDANWESRYNNFVENVNKLEEERLSVVDYQNNFEANKSDIDKAVGKYMQTEENMGWWGGVLLDSFLKGQGRVAASGTALFIDGIVNIMPTESLTGDYPERFVDAAKKLGYKVEDYKKLKTSLSEDQIEEINDKVDDELKKELKYKYGTLETARETNVKVLGSDNVTKQYEAKFKEGFFGGAIAGLTESLPSMLGPSPARVLSMYSNITDNVSEEMENDPTLSKLSETEKSLVSVPIGIVSAILEEFGLRNVVANKGLLNKLVMRMLGKVSPGVTSRTFAELVRNDVESMVARGLLTVGGAALAEFETGAAQEASEQTIKEIYNKVKGDDVFKQIAQTPYEFIGDMMYAGAQEAVGGFVLGSIPAVSAAYRKTGFEGMSDIDFEKFERIANDDKVESAFVTSLKTQINSGEISVEDAKQTLNDYRKSRGLYKQLPDNLTTENKKKAMNLLRERQELDQQISGKDAALVKTQKARIEEINSLLETISKPENNAVQEQATSEVPVQPGAPVGGKVAEGKPQAEPEVVTEEGQAKEEVIPAGKRLFNEPNPETVEISKAYKEKNGIVEGEGVKIEAVDVDNASKIADAFEALEDSPNDPEVQDAYNAMADETAKQHQDIVDAGYEVEIWDGEGEPYANAQEMIDDVKNNKHMYIFSTEQGFGDEPITDEQRKQNKLLQDSGLKDKNGKPLLYNDLFRFVHDFFGHTERGNGFGPVGEENAWDVHARMYSPKARRAMTTETRGQNSWVNFGPQMRNEDGSLKKKGDPGYLSPKDRAFAPQKMALMPEEFSQIREVVSEFDQAVNNSAQSLKMVAPDLKVIVAENTEDAQLQIAEALSAVAPSQAADVAEGFTTETRGQTVFVNGKPFAIVLDKSQADSKTVGHEAWEVMLNDAFGDDQAKFKEFRDEIDRQLRLKGFGDIADALTKFSNQRGYEDVKYSEYMAELGGMLVANGFKQGSLDAKQKSLLQKIGDVINKFAQLFTGKKQFLDEATPDDILGFMITISNKVAKGEDVSQFFRGETPGATMDGGIIAKSQIGPDSVDDQFDMSIQYDDSNMPDKLSMPDVETIEKVLEESGGAAVFINSDGTKVGITRDNKKLQGGWRYTYFKENIDDNIGFAATSESHVGTFHKLIQQIAKERDELNPSMKGKPIAVFVTVQNAESMLGEWYAGEFLMDGIDKAITEKKTTVAKARKLVDAAIVDAQKRYIDSERKLSESKGKTRTLQDIKSDSQYKQLEKLKSIIKEKGFDTHDGRIKAAKVLGSKDFSFKFRSSFLSELIPLKSVNSNSKNPEIKKLLLDVGYGRKDFYKDTMDEVLYDALEKSNFKENSIGGTTLGGFYADPYVTKEAFLKNKNKGIQHEMFNESFSSNGKTFRLDKARNVNKLFPSMGFPDAKGYSLYNEANNSSESKASGIVGKNKVTKWLLDNGYEKNVTNPFTAISGTFYTSTIDEDYQKKEPSIKTKAQKVEKIQNETNFVPTSFWVETLKGNVDYLDNVIEHILKARDILKSGKVTQKMTTKSYLITLSSMGSGGGYYDNWKAKTGKTVEDIFIEKQNGREWLRPEGAAAAYLSTEEGKKLVIKINSGTATKDEIKKLFDYVGTGRESSKADYVEKTMQADGLKKMTDLFNENKGSDFSELFDGAIKNLKGIGEGKTGFFNQYFGVSSRGVVDARQMNAWVSGSMKLTEEQKKLKKKIESSPKLQQELLSKIEEVGIELGYPKDLAAYIAHHAIWDAIAQNITKHEGEYIVTRSQKSVPAVVDEVLTDDGKGNYVFVHYSDEKRDTIKPMSGSKKNFTSREEVAAISSVGGVAMYYTKQGQKEQGVGDVPHTVLVPKDKVYFYGTTERGKVSNDPENFYPEARRRFQEYKNMNNPTRPTEYAFDANNAAAWITKVAAENGYDMVVTNWGPPMSYRAQTVKELTPEAEYTGFKQIPEPQYEVGDEVFLYGQYVILTDVKPDVLTYETEAGYGKYPLTVMTRDKIIMIQKAKPTVTTKSQKVVVNTIPGYERMMGEVEGILDKTMNRTGSYNQATANAIGYIQKSAVYERADDSQREQIIRDFLKIRGEKIKVAPSVGKILGQIKDVKKVTVNEKTALKDQVKLEAKAAKDAVAFVKQLRMQISGRLKIMAGRGVISAKQASTILARYDKMNILNPVMRDRFVDYMSNVLQTAEYKDKIAQASKLRRSISKAAKSEANQAEVAKIAKAFNEISPSMVDNIDQYIEFAESLLKSVSRKVGSPLMRDVANFEDMINYIDDQIQKQREQIKNDLLSQNQDLVDAGVLSSKMTINEIKKVLQAIENKEDQSEEKLKEAKKAVKEMMDEMSPIIKKIVRTGEDPFTGDPIDLTIDEKRDLIKLADMDTDDLSLANAIKAVEYANNFIANGITSGISGLVNNYEGSLNATELKDEGVKSAPIKKYFFKSPGRMWLQQVGTLPMLNRVMWVTSKRALEVMDKSGVSGVSTGKAKAISVVDKIVNEYTSKFSKIKDFLTAENIIERGMLAFMSRTVIGDEFQVQDEYNRRKTLIEETIEALKDPTYNTDAEIKKGKTIQKVYDKILKGSKNIADVKSKVSETNQKAVDWWVSEWIKKYDRLDEVSRNVYNTILSRDANYTPDRFQMKEASPAEIEDFESGFFGSFEYVNTSKSGSLRENNRIKNLPKDNNGVRKRIVNLDFDTNNVNAMTSAMVDVETASSIEKVKGFVTSKDFSKLFASPEDANLYKKRTIGYVNTVKGGGYVDQSEMAKLNKLSNAIASLGTAKALFSVSQIPKQFVPPMLNTLAQTGRFDIAELFRGGMNFINESGYPIATRGIGSQGELKSINRKLEEADRNLAVKGLKGILDLNNNAVGLVLKYPDMWAARSSWISFYISNLKKQGVKTSNIDWSTHELNKKAADYAQLMVDSQQNISDTDMQGDLFTSKQPATVFLRRAFFPLMSFTLNQKTRIWADSRTLASKLASKEDKSEAARSISGAIVEQVAFAAIRLEILKALWYTAKAIWGDEDEEDEEYEKKILMRQASSTAQNFMKDFFLPPLPLIDAKASEGVNYLLDQSGLSSSIPKNWYGIENEDVTFNFYVPEKTSVLDQLGTQGIAAEKLGELYDNIRMSTTGRFSETYRDNEVEKQILDEDKDAAAITSAVLTATTIGVLPSEFASVANLINKKIKRRAENVEEN